MLLQTFLYCMTGKFADPDVSDQVIEDTQDSIEDKEPVYPWDVLEDMEDMGYEKKEARKALRKLRMSNHAVPTAEFKGKICLAKRYETGD